MYERHYNVNTDLEPEDRDTMHTLISYLGHDIDNIAPTIAVTHDPISTRLHLSEYLRDSTGLPARDVAARHIATCPRVHDINPHWLPAAIRPEDAHADA